MWHSIGQGDITHLLLFHNELNLPHMRQTNKPNSKLYISMLLHCFQWWNKCLIVLSFRSIEKMYFVLFEMLLYTNLFLLFFDNCYLQNYSQIWYTQPANLLNNPYIHRDNLNVIIRFSHHQTQHLSCMNKHQLFNMI